MASRIDLEWSTPYYGSNATVAIDDERSRPRAVSGRLTGRKGTQSCGTIRTSRQPLNTLIASHPETYRTLALARMAVLATHRLSVSPTTPPRWRMAPLVTTTPPMTRHHRISPINRGIPAVSRPSGPGQIRNASRRRHPTHRAPIQPTRRHGSVLTTTT